MTRVGIFLLSMGATASIALMLGGVRGLPLVVLTLIGGVHGGVFTLIGLWLQKIQKELAPLKSVEELAAEFGSTAPAVQALADAHSIRARVNINGENLYHPDEFLASRSLLRGAAAPLQPETLLRAVEPAAPPIAQETLLRAAQPDASDEVQEHMARLYVDADSSASDHENQIVQH